MSMRASARASATPQEFASTELGRMAIDQVTRLHTIEIRSRALAIGYGISIEFDFVADRFREGFGMLRYPGDGSRVDASELTGDRHGAVRGGAE